MSDFKFKGQKVDKDLVASIAKLLDANGIPNVMWGPYVLACYGVPLVLDDFAFVIPDQHIDRARDVLLAANFPLCPQGDDCHLLQPICTLPHSYAHFILKDEAQPPRGHNGQTGFSHPFRLELHKKSQLLWTLPDIPLGAPAPDDPNYMLVTGDRTDVYDTRMQSGRVPYTHYPVKMPTLPRYAESLAYGYLRNQRPEGEGHSLQAGFFLHEMTYIGLYCILDRDDLAPRLHRFWRLWNNPRSSQPLFRYSARLAAELRSANFFPQEEEEGEAQEST
ncbi:hypothetical protein Asppvi_003936 [Aspergillus pseudoviridinutans]|uniref:Uncharacterized protein n=1 Tax=Aspergillus pseudoviridinutans TaxID=1517512 RepID=A0A9P3B5E3_9EURO|nr:uncharacterized protein Asppvi_003936 [Aspergillus pseudoviridinutans]GIJ85081.1 hypothetical protein Asppvi_003936 [Aspergillus pseudoviridinutans]